MKYISHAQLHLLHSVFLMCLGVCFCFFAEIFTGCADDGFLIFIHLTGGDEAMGLTTVLTLCSFISTLV